jgi:hypothetical protein
VSHKGTDAERERGEKSGRGAFGGVGVYSHIAEGAKVPCRAFFRGVRG